jgi:hypothetical protein
MTWWKKILNIANKNNTQPVSNIDTPTPYNSHYHTIPDSCSDNIQDEGISEDIYKVIKRLEDGGFIQILNPFVAYYPTKTEELQNPIPEWANYRATDKNGAMYYFELKPQPNQGVHEWNLWELPTNFAGNSPVEFAGWDLNADPAKWEQSLISTVEIPAVVQPIVSIADWDSAPEWANYRAMDADGREYWFEYEPTIDEELGLWEAFDSDGHCDQILNTARTNWRFSLQKRKKI